MIDDLKPYAQYCDAGDSWLRKLPKGWVLRRMKHLFRQRNVKGFPNEPLLAATQTKGVVRKEQYETRTTLAIKDLHLLKLVRAGDFVISLRSFQGGIEYAREQGIISPAYTVLYSVDPSTHDYFAWLFKSKPYVEQLSLYVTGIRQGQNIDYERLSRSLLPVPPDEARRAIVRFLDHAERRIRRYIKAKRRLIALLNEQKQAIIHRAVTRGLDPNVRLKPSGVEWLGDVPEHWDVLPIKRAFISIDYGISESSTDDGTVRVLTMGNIQNGRVRIPATGGVASVDPLLLLRDGDLLFNRTNSAELVGKVGLFRGADSSVTFASYLVRLRPRAEHEPEYLNLVLNDTSILSAARREAIPSLRQSNLNPTRYGRLQIALPKQHEQEAIIQATTSNTASLENAISAAQSEMALVLEYRPRLIADVVTGKLDVREAAARLPNEANDFDTPDGAEVLADSDEQADDADVEAVPEEVEV